MSDEKQLQDFLKRLESAFDIPEIVKQLTKIENTQAESDVIIFAISRLKLPE